jgi:hypothetical protein
MEREIQILEFGTIGRPASHGARRSHTEGAAGTVKYVLTTKAVSSLMWAELAIITRLKSGSPQTSP